MFRFDNWLRRPALAAALLAMPAVSPAAIPHADHVVVVVMENKPYSQARVQAYTASLIAQGAELTNSFASNHPSQPNYITLWCGNSLGVSNDNCPAPGSPYPYENLGSVCEGAGLTWKAYSENLAVAGSTACSYDGNVSTGLYVRKHEPWTYFSNVNHANERPYADLAADLAGNTLPNLAFVIPNNCHNTHNATTAGCTIADGDNWLAANVPPILAKLGPKGVLILTWDEDDNSLGNHILTVFAGAPVIPGAKFTGSVAHPTVVRTITELLGLPTLGVVAGYTPIDNIWYTPVPVAGRSWGRLKSLYR